MCTIVFGFFAVLIARELPGRTRVWPYLLAGVVTTAIGFARLYLGAHWPSDLVGGTLFGILWLLVLGIAYRRHVARSFWMRPLAWLFYGDLRRSPRCGMRRASADALLAKFAAATPTTVIGQDDWWQRDWAQLPAQRNERDRAPALAAGRAGGRPAGTVAGAAAGAGLARAAAGRLGRHGRPARRRQAVAAAAGAAGHAGCAGRGTADAARRRAQGRAVRAAAVAGAGAARRRHATVAGQQRRRCA